MMSPAVKRATAVVLLGPSGAGKSPLGDILSRRGLWGRPCRHFDFGAQLRRAAAGQLASVLSRGEAEFVRELVRTGSLLEDEHFSIARRILTAFLDEPAASDDEWVVLNGLPRHIGQAKGVEEIIRVEAVVELSCTADVALRRIAMNAEGDRAGRPDDDAASVLRRFEVYRRRAAPLVDHYRAVGRRVEVLNVDADSAASALWEELQRRGGAPKEKQTC